MKTNLFVIGASKCGTTFLHDVLNGHPEIQMSKEKEIHFFSVYDSEKGFGWYESKFSQTPHAVYIGESSPTYSETTYFAGVPEKIFRYNQNAKLIYLVRSPFSRLKSVYRQALSTGHWYEKKYYDVKMPLNFPEAVFSCPPLLEATRYYTQIKNFLHFFPESAIKIVLFERLIGDTSSSLREIFGFLGVDECPEIDLESAEKNKGEGKTVFNPWPSRIRSLLPDGLLRVFPEGVKRIARQSAQRLPIPDAPRPRLNSADEAKVREILAPEVEGIYRHLGIDDDPWQWFANPNEGGAEG